MRDKTTVMPFTFLESTSSMSIDDHETQPAPIQKENSIARNLNPYKEMDIAGYGIERCLYEWHPDLACLSPYLIHAAVLTPPQALIALEGVASQPNRPPFPVDRHLAAFFMSRWKEMSISDTRDMVKPQREIKNMATLRILASIQDQFKICELPNLCQWMADLCVPMIAQHYNQKMHTQAQEKIAKAVSSGQLGALLQVLQNGREIREDKGDYQAAKIEILLIESEIKEIESKILNRNQSAPKITSIWRWVSYTIYWVQTIHLSRKGKIRIAKLYQQSELLQETWGEDLLQSGGKPSLNFWKELRAKIKATKLLRYYSKNAVDAPLKYD